MAVEWVEVRGPDVEVAVQAALAELGLDGPEAAEIEVLQEPEKGFLGMGGKDALVRVKPKQQRSGRRRRGGRGRRGKGDGGSRGDASRSKDSGARQRSKNQTDRRPPRNDTKKQEPQKSKSSSGSSGGGSKARNARKSNKEQKVEVEVDRTEQAALVQEFLSGLLDAFGLEGEVTSTVEEDIIIADVSGEQTEALVGPKGAILQAVLELSRTIVQRKSQAGARIRLDIAGYQERRREALRIYTGRLVEKVLEEGGEIMLEPMNAADRKVVHDAAADLGGVRTYSEGEEPRRSVVIAKDEESG